LLLRFSSQNGCAAQAPLYALLVSVALAVSKTGYPFLVFMEEFLGAATSICAFFIGRHLFSDCLKRL
jgi:hypothetical protein